MLGLSDTADPSIIAGWGETLSFAFAHDGRDWRTFFRIFKPSFFYFSFSAV